ncbi:MAG: class I SAM-dependent RNA methyltransferase [Hyphomicrobiaceae bacterium]
MTAIATEQFEIFLATAPGLEDELRKEAKDKSFKGAQAIKGGVSFVGGWTDVWRANLELRGAGRVMARIAEFRALHLAQLDKRARRVAWATFLRPDQPFRVEATCRASRIYHSGAAAQRVERAIHETLGAKPSSTAAVCIRVRLDDDLCTLAIDTSGELLHRRGFKEAVAKAPMRETLAALFLRQCGYRGTEPVVDPMCGSGTFVIEAAEIAAGLCPGRARAFAFEHLATFDAAAWQHMRDVAARRQTATDLRFYGRDRDAGAITMARANAERAGIASLIDFCQRDVAELTAPEGPPGLVMVNPPYGDRIGDGKQLTGLYRSLGERLLRNFPGWRVGLVTTDATLAAATALPFTAPRSPVAHGGLRITLYTTPPLA